MIFTLTDRNYKELDIYETDDYQIGVYTGYIINSLTMNVLNDDDRSGNWVEGNYVFCKDAKGTTYWFVIRSVDDSLTNGYRNIQGYTGTLDILNEDANPIVRPAQTEPFEYYFNKVFKDTGIKLGVNEISSYKRRLEFTSTESSNAEMLQYVLRGFGSEAKLRVVMTGTVPKHIYLDVHKRIGKTEPQSIITDYDDTLQELDRVGSIVDLATCLIPLGVDEEGEELTLEGKYYEEKDSNGEIVYFSPIDSPRIFSVQARQDYYVKIPGKAKGEFDGYITRRYRSEAETKDTLWTAGLAQLKQIDKPVVAYEVKGFIDCDPGDNVYIISHKMKPPLYLKARVLEYMFNDDDPSRNEYVFGNYEIMDSHMSDLDKLMADLKKRLVSIESQIIEYAVTDNNGATPTEWQLTYIPPNPGQWLWTRTTTIFTNGEQSVGYTTSRAGEDGYTPIKGKDYFDGAKGEDSVFLYLDSVNGTVFKNTSIATIITVTVIVAEHRLDTSAKLKSYFGSHAYVQWQYKQSEHLNFTDLALDDPRISDNGFIFTLTTEDVGEKTIFNCNLIY